MPTKTGSDGYPDWYVASLARGLRVICAFDKQHSHLTVSEVAARVGISRAAARRFLMTLEDLGYVGAGKGQRYFLRPRVLMLGYSYLSSLNVGEHIQMLIKRSTELTGRTCSLVVLDGNEIVFIAREISHQPLQMYIRTGDRLPAYATSTGKILLAFLSDAELDVCLAGMNMTPLAKKTVTDPELLKKEILAAREKGYAVAEGEIAPGIASVAVPVRNGDNMVVAALNVNSQSGEEDSADMVRKYLPVLQATATEIEQIFAAIPATDPLSS